jgi:hypothetical protein
MRQRGAGWFVNVACPSPTGVGRGVVRRPFLQTGGLDVLRMIDDCIIDHHPLRSTVLDANRQQGWTPTTQTTAADATSPIDEEGYEHVNR